MAASFLFNTSSKNHSQKHPQLGATTLDVWSQVHPQQQCFSSCTVIGREVRWPYRPLDTRPRTLFSRFYAPLYILTDLAQKQCKYRARSDNRSNLSIYSFCIHGAVGRWDNRVYCQDDYWIMMRKGLGRKRFGLMLPPAWSNWEKYKKNLTVGRPRYEPAIFWTRSSNVTHRNATPCMQH